MASGTTTLIVGGIVVAAGAYFFGLLCPFGLCPPNMVPKGTRGLGPAVPQEGDVPINDIVWRTQGRRGGYGDDYDYEANAAVISIA